MLPILQPIVYASVEGYSGSNVFEVWTSTIEHLVIHGDAQSVQRLRAMFHPMPIHATTISERNADIYKCTGETQSHTICTRTGKEYADRRWRRIDLMKERENVVAGPEEGAQLK